MPVSRLQTPQRDHQHGTVRQQINTNELKGNKSQEGLTLMMLARLVLQDCSQTS
jgi:hypothetical protein